MTKKITVSLPDDVAEQLARQPNVSAFVAEAVRRRFAAEHTREVLTALGFDITDEGIEAARAEDARLRAAITPELRLEAAKLHAELKSGRPRLRDNG